MRQKQTRHDRLLPDSARSPDKLQVNQLLNQADGTSIPPYVHCLPDDRLFICGLLFKHAFLRCASWDLSLDEAVKLGVPSQRVDVLLSEISHPCFGAKVVISSLMEDKVVITYSQVFRGSMLTTSRDSFCILLSWKSLNLKGLMMGNFNLPVKLKME